MKKKTLRRVFWTKEISEAKVYNYKEELERIKEICGFSQWEIIKLEE